MYNINIIKVKELTLKVLNNLNFWRSINMKYNGINVSEQEMIAKAQEARAKVIEAEADVPKAMAEAFRNGNLGIMDYYRMKNMEADTTMREAIAKPQK